MAQVEFNVPGPGTYLIEADPSLPPLANPGQAGDVLDGEQFYDNEGNPVTGTMPNNPAQDVVIPGGGSYTIPQGYHTGRGTVTSSGAVLPALTDPADSGEIAAGKEVIDQNGAVMTGTMPSNPAVSETLEAGESYQVPAGYTPGGTVQAASLASQTLGTATEDDIVQGKTAWVNGVQIAGALEPGTDTGDATATAADILEGKTAYVATGKVEGTIPSQGAQTITPGTQPQIIQSNVYLTGVQTVQGDANLMPDNIKENVSIFGVVGTYAGDEGTGNFSVPLTVNVDTGATVTAVNGDTTLTATSVNGQANFVLTSGGTWTITGAIGDRIAQTFVSVTSSYTASIVLPNEAIYGAEWDGSSNPAWTRTDAAADFVAPSPAVNNGTGSSPFDSIMPWSGMQIVEDETAGTLVSIPKYYYKWTRAGTAMKLQISAIPQEGFLVSPAHADRGDGQGERDMVYVGRYHCGTTYKSTTGVQPLKSIGQSTARTNIHALGSDIWQYDYAMYWTIMMLYLVEYANWNSQAMIGYGCSPEGAIFDMGLTDSMIYHTGTSATSRTTYGSIQYRHIEGLWDNVCDWCDGIYFSGANVYCIKNPANFSDSGGTLVGTRNTRGGYITAWNNPIVEGFEYALCPSATEGSESEYICDSAAYSLNWSIRVWVGGSFVQEQVSGAFYQEAIGLGSSDQVGTRLQKLP